MFESFEILPGDDLLCVGIVSSIVVSEGTVVVKANVTKTPLNEGEFT